MIFTPAFGDYALSAAATAAVIVTAAAAAVVRGTAAIAAASAENKDDEDDPEPGVAAETIITHTVLHFCRKERLYKLFRTASVHTVPENRAGG